MPRTSPPTPRTGTPRWVDWALMAAGLALVGASALMVAQGASGGFELRQAARSLVLGVALGTYGLYRLANRRHSSRAQQNAPTTSPVAAGSPQPPSTPPRSASAGRRGAGASNLEGMLLHSADACATLRDVVAHAHDASYAPLKEMLVHGGLMAWGGTEPPLRAVRLTRNGRWWLHAPVGLEERDYDMVVSLEGALNLAEDLRDAKDVREALARAAYAEPRPYEGSHQLSELLGGSKKGQEWNLRATMSSYLENLPLPYRVTFKLQACAPTSVVCVDVACPRPACFELVGPGATTPADEARAYALRLAVVVAHGALRQAAARLVVVNCGEHVGEDPVLSLRATADDLPRLERLARDPALAGSPLPDDPSLRARERADGWLAPTKPFMRRDDPEVWQDERVRLVELDEASCCDELRRACGARRFCDLGIHENAGRVHAWNSITRDLGETTQGAVSKLMGVRSATKDLTVAEACDRVCKALVDGTADVADRQQLALLFVDGSPLAEAVRRADATLAQNSTAEQLTSALDELEGLLAPLTEVGVYLDDTAFVYRYFNSVSERVAYNRTSDDQGRKLVLVPDEYYGAHSDAAHILGRLDRFDEALSHADELVRVAPMTTDAALSRVRALENQTRIFEAADVLTHTIERASSPRDMSVCFYRLAYMEWKLGRSDLAVACYQRSIQLHRDFAAQATAELDSLLAANDGLSRLPDDEVTRVLEAAGLPTGPVDRALELALAGAAACADAQAFGPASALASLALELAHDDVLSDVRRSLGRPST